MPIAEKSLVTFRLIGDDLCPHEVTRLLGCAPDVAYAKGDVHVGKATGLPRTRRIGCWQLRSRERVPEDLPGQIEELLSRLPEDPAAWATLRSRFEIHMFCGVFMSTSNDGVIFPAALLGALAARGIELQLDLYSPDSPASVPDAGSVDG